MPRQCMFCHLLLINNHSKCSELHLKQLGISRVLVSWSFVQCSELNHNRALPDFSCGWICMHFVFPPCGLCFLLASHRSGATPKNASTGPGSKTAKTVSLKAAREWGPFVQAHGIQLCLSLPNAMVKEIIGVPWCHKPELLKQWKKADEMAQWLKANTAFFRSPVFSSQTLASSSRYMM